MRTRNTPTWIAAALLLLPLAACEHSLVGRNMGNAFRENVSAQIADPEAGRANEPGPEGIDGSTGEDVMRAYHKGQATASTRGPAPVLIGGGTSN